MLVPQLTRSIQMLMEALIATALLEGCRVFRRTSAAGPCDRFGNAGKVLKQVFRVTECFRRKSA